MNKKTFFAGMITTALLFSLIGTALAAYQVQATLSYSDIKITLNGETVTPTDANGATVEPFIMDGSTYLPVRAISNALGVDVDWDGTTNTVVLTDDAAYAQPDYSSELQVVQDYLVAMNYFKKIDDFAQETSTMVDGISSYGIFALSESVSTDGISFALECYSGTYIPDVDNAIQACESEVNSLIGSMSTDAGNEYILLASDYLSALRSNIDNLNGMVSALSSYNLTSSESAFDDYMNYRAVSDELTNQMEIDAYQNYNKTLFYVQTMLDIIS